MKLTKRNRKKYKSEPSAYELMWQRVDSLAQRVSGILLKLVVSSEFMANVESIR